MAALGIARPLRHDEAEGHGLALPCKRPLGVGFALAMALSFGDFGIVALFGGTELRTLPYLLYERLGAYRLDEASAIGLLILVAAFCLAHFSGRLSHAED